MKGQMSLVPGAAGQVPFSRATVMLIGINVTAFMMQLVLPGFTDAMSLTPALAMNGAYWQFVTYMFMHGSFIHLFFNMFVLMIFGLELEAYLGKPRFLTLYFVSGIFSAVFYMLLTNEAFVPMLGASGAVFAVLAAYAFAFPNNIVWIGFLFPLPAKYAVIVFALLELFFGVFSIEAGVANFGHVGGILAGFAIMLFWRKKARRGRSGEWKDLKFFWE